LQDVVKVGAAYDRWSFSFTSTVSCALLHWVVGLQM